jgi:hypothetical protein
MKKMKNIFLIVSVIILSQAVSGQNKIVSELESHKVGLPNGWTLTPVGKQMLLGDLPLNLVISHNKKWAAVTNNGQSTQTIDLIDIEHQKKTDSTVIAKSWYGLAFSSDDTVLYASGGHDNMIKTYSVKKGN